jgi:hypothetical protein
MSDSARKSASLSPTAHDGHESREWSLDGRRSGPARASKTVRRAYHVGKYRDVRRAAVAAALAASDGTCAQPHHAPPC